MLTLLASLVYPPARSVLVALVLRYGTLTTSLSRVVDFIIVGRYVDTTWFWTDFLNDSAGIRFTDSSGAYYVGVRP